VTQDDIHALLERFRLAWLGHDVNALAACYADDCVVVSPFFKTLTGRSHVEKSFNDLFKVFSNQAITVEDVVIGGDEPARAVTVWKLHSTHIGEVFGIQPSGRSITRTVVFVLTLSGGVITKETRIYDFTSMLIELGVLRAKPAT
jgi:steroid delta-isomerase-like uncharacterized protein